MKPYYDHAGITIYHADARDILPALSPLELVITDPPYGLDYQSTRRIHSKRTPKIHGDDAYPTWLFDYPFQRALYAWCRWDILPLLPTPKSFIVWDKLRHSMGDLAHEYGRQWEAIAFYAGPSHEWKKGRPVDIIRAACVPSRLLQHPNEKPVSVMGTLIEHCNGKVCDPFMGSGTTLVAAKSLNRRAIGIEIEERYCEIAATRLSQEFMLFDHEYMELQGEAG